MNLKKIIEERLENARLDFLNAINNEKATDREIGELQYTALTYQDCLNLIPAPRTEQEILDDFEKLGWIVSIKSKREIILRRNPEKYTAIWIDKLTKEYLSNAYLSITEHKLLNELFTVWGWL